jgi:hypothetical protein
MRKRDIFIPVLAGVLGAYLLWPSDDNNDPNSKSTIQIQAPGSSTTSSSSDPYSPIFRNKAPAGPLPLAQTESERTLEDEILTLKEKERVASCRAYASAYDQFLHDFRDSITNKEDRADLSGFIIEVRTAAENYEGKPCLELARLKPDEQSCDWDTKNYLNQLRNGGKTSVVIPASLIDKMCIRTAPLEESTLNLTRNIASRYDKRMDVVYETEDGTWIKTEAYERDQDLDGSNKNHEFDENDWLEMSAMDSEGNLTDLVIDAQSGISGTYTPNGGESQELSDEAIRSAFRTYAPELSSAVNNQLAKLPENAKNSPWYDSE